MTRSHVANTPALIRHGLANLLQQLLVHFGRGELLGDRNKVLHCEQPYRVLVVGLQAAVNGEAIAEDVRLGKILHKCLEVREQHSIDGCHHAYTEPFSRSPANHGRIVRGKSAVALSQAILNGRRDFGVDGGVESGG